MKCNPGDGRWAPRGGLHWVQDQNIRERELIKGIKMEARRGSLPEGQRLP